MYHRLCGTGANKESPQSALLQRTTLYCPTFHLDDTHGPEYLSCRLCMAGEWHFSFVACFIYTGAANVTERGSFDFTAGQGSSLYYPIQVRVIAFQWVLLRGPKREGSVVHG